MKTESWRLGKSGVGSFVDFGDIGRVWVRDPETMNAIWSLALFVVESRR